MLLASFDIEAVDTPDGGPARERMAFTMNPVGLRMRLRDAADVPVLNRIRTKKRAATSRPVAGAWRKPPSLLRQHHRVDHVDHAVVGHDVGGGDLGGVDRHAAGRATTSS